MPDSYGLLSGLTEGLKGFLQGQQLANQYEMQKQEMALKQRQADMHEKQYRMTLAEHGLRENSDYGKTAPVQKSNESIDPNILSKSQMISEDPSDVQSREGFLAGTKSAIDTATKDVNTSDEFIPTADAAGKIDVKKLQAKREAELNDASSQASRRMRETSREALKASGYKNPEKIIPDDMSGEEVKSHPMIKGMESGGFGLQGKQMMASVFGERNNIQREGLGLREDAQAAKAKGDITKDPIIKQLNQNVNAADRAMMVLSKPGLTSQEFNDVQIEVSNMVAGARNSALGKLERTEYGKSLAQGAEDLLAKLKGVPVESAPPELVNRLKSLVVEMRSTFTEQKAQQASSIKSPYKHNKQAQEAQDAAISDASAAAEAPAQGLIQPPAQGLIQAPAAANVEHNAALEWLQKNPNDPGAPAVRDTLKKNGVIK